MKDQIIRYQLSSLGYSELFVFQKWSLNIKCRKKLLIDNLCVMSGSSPTT